MKVWKKRVLSIICAVALVVTSVYVSDYKKAKAATTTKLSMNIAAVNNILGLNIGGLLNIPMTGMGDDYSSTGNNFMTESFIDQYITFGGGMTKADLLDGMLTSYVATKEILQFNWANRTTTFKDGWSFTIAAGAQLPYNGTSASAPLDREYVFLFVDGAPWGYDNVVKFSANNVTTFSLGKLSIWGNGVSGSGETIKITEIEGVTSWNTKYQDIHNDASYKDYVEISDLTFEEFDGDIKLRYILDGGTKCFQMEEWGSLRTSMTPGDQLIFRKGLPIYFVDGSGNQWKALLDATYVYECTGSNGDNTQVFYGVKIDDSTPEYGLNINSSQTTGPQSATNPEQYINVNFDYATVQAGVVQAHSTSEDILKEKIAEEYIQVANYTPAEASALGIAFRYIPNANVIQMGFGSAAVAALKVGDTIVLKEGMPVVYLYNGTLYAAKLDAEYTFTVTANNGTNLTFSRTLSDTYSLTGTMSGPSAPEGGYTYFGLPITPDEFEDAQRGEGSLDASAWQPYISLSNHTTADLTTDGTHMRWYTYLPNVFQGIRLYSNLSFVDGEQLIIKKGLPITYNTSVVNYSDGSGVKKKVTYLDKDYGFVYNASTGKFVYDASLGNQEEEPEVTVPNISITALEFGTFPEAGYYKSNIGYATDTTISVDNAPYIDENEESWSYVENADLIAKMQFIPSAGVFQILWASTLNHLDVGKSVTLKEGMPIYYMSGGVEKKAVIAEDTTLLVVGLDTVSATQSARFFRYNGSRNFGIETSGMTPTAGGNYNHNVLDNALADALSPTYDQVPSQVIEKHGEFCGLTASQLDAYGVKIYLIRDGDTQVLQIQWGSDISYLKDGATILLKKGMPFVYKTSDTGRKCLILKKDYGFVYNASTGQFVYDSTIGNVAGTFEFETLQMNTYVEVDNSYRMNLKYTSETTFTPDKEQTDLLTNATTAKYIDFCGFDEEAISQLGVRVIFIPSAKVFQLVFGSSLDSYYKGATITFKEGMPVAYQQDGATVTAVLDKEIKYTVTEATLSSVTVSVLAEPAEYTLGIEVGLNDGDWGPFLAICDPITKEQTVMDDAKGAYTTLDSSVMAAYVDFAGMTAQDMATHGLEFRVIKDGNTEVLQMKTGTAVSTLVVGDRITFKKGLPLQYTTTEGLRKTITLAEDVVYTVDPGNADYAVILRQTSVQAGTWDFEYGVVNVVSGSETGAEGYYNNIRLDSSCEMMSEVTKMNYLITADQMKKYVDFAGLDAETYGFAAYVIITPSDTVVQLRWGSTSAKVKEGDKIIFYEGLPVSATITENGESKTKVYLLDRTVTFTVEKHEEGNNGFRLNSLQEESNATAGDADGDYLQNVNDVTLVREHLAELVNIHDDVAVDVTEDGFVDSKDLVRIKKLYGKIAEKEGYTLIYKSNNAATVVPGTTKDTKADVEAAGAFTTISFGDNGVSIGKDAYIRLTYKASENFRGTFVYSVNGKSNVEEEFYIEAKDSQFEQFLDVFRPNGINGNVSSVNEIVLKSIKLYNLSSNDANIVISRVEHAERDVITDDMIYAWEEGGIKIGIDLNMGGSIGYVSSLKHDVYEYLNTDSKEVIIGTKAQMDATANKTNLSQGKEVNLTNIYDWGRQIQQSYYTYPGGAGDVDWEGNAFKPGTYNSNRDWPYNPVQAGDKNHNRSQIVDYRDIDTDADGNADFIYVKVRPMSWSESNVTTDSYMENWYRIEDNMVYVDNGFVDWSGFELSTKILTQELPAFYAGQALNTFVSDKNGVQQKDTNLDSWTDDDHYTNTTTTTDWYAYVNSEASDAFGIGLYIPNVDATVAGRSKPTRRYQISAFNSSTWGATMNANADDAAILDYGLTYIDNLYQHRYQSCFVQNTSYIAPVCSGTMKGYKGYFYTYVITADTLDQMDDAFTSLKESGEVTNVGLGNW